MLTTVWLDSLPLWALFGLTVVSVLAAMEVGRRLAVYRTRVADKGEAGPIGSVIGGILGLLAFVLAFTFGMAAARFDARRELLLNEVNAIGTCYLRAEMVTEPEGREIRERLREYVRLRAQVAQRPESLPETVARCEALQDEMWSQAILATKKDGQSQSMTHALFVASLNEVIDFHTKRTVVGAYRIPATIWLALYGVSLLSMAGVGYQFGRAGARDVAIAAFLAVAFSIVIALIADLDRIDQGSLQVSQQPMIDLDRKLEATAP